MNFKGVEICCPHCRADLEPSTRDGQDSLWCLGCSRQFPVVAGIPDLRVFPDPYIHAEADRAKGLNVAAKLDQLSFEELIAYYYSNTSVVPPHHAKLYTRGLLAAAPRAAAALESWESAVATTGNATSASDLSLLEIGCGTAPLLVAAARNYRQVAGIDIAFRWLVVGKKRLAEAGLDVPLICACAEALPFPDGAFDRVAADSTIEVVKDQSIALAEAHRVLRPAGHLCIATPNRFSIGPDPHTGIPAGSWLPEKWVASIVRKQGGIPPQRNLLSARSLKRLVRTAGFGSPKIMLPDVPAAQRMHFRGAMRLAIDGYCIARRLPVSAQMLQLIGPVLHAVAAKVAEASAGTSPSSQRARRETAASLA